jgi:hypothetical protein
MVEAIRAQLETNKTNYQSRAERGLVEPREIQFQLYSGYDSINGYLNKVMFIDNAGLDLEKPDIVVKVGKVVNSVVGFNSEPSFIGLAMRSGAFNKDRFIQDLFSNDDNLIKAYFSNIDGLVATKRGLLERSASELERLSGDLESAKESKDYESSSYLYSQLLKLKDIIRRLRIGHISDDDDGKLILKAVLAADQVSG